MAAIRALVVGLLSLSLSSSLAAAQEQAEISARQRDAFRSARTARIVVTQAYDADSVTLPFEEAVRTLLERAGLSIVERDDADLVVRIVATGRAQASTYYAQGVGPSRSVYMGAVVSGRVTFEAPGIPTLVAPFRGEVEPPSTVVLTGERSSLPSDAPFRKAYLARGSFLPVVLSVVAGAFGPDPLAESLLDIDGFFGVLRRNGLDAPFSTSESGTRLLLLEELGRTRESSTVQRLISTFQAHAHLDRLAGIRYRNYSGTDAALTWAVRENPDPAVRAEAASVLRKFSAAQALGRIRDPASLPTLVGALQGEHEMVTAAAVEALGALADGRAVSPLSALLKPQAGVELRIAAARALGRIGDAQAVPALVEAVRDRERRVGYAALGALGNLKAVDALVPFLGDREFGGFVAGELGRSGERRAIPLLVEALERDHAPAAAYALARLEAFDALVPLLADSFPLALDVSHALEATKSARATELLIQMLERGGVVPQLVYQTLRGLTGQRISNDAQAWLAWSRQAR